MCYERKSKAIPHNSKCRYGERGAADAKPKAQIILDAAKVSAASGGNSEPKQGQRAQSARGFCLRSTMRVPQPDIIEHFGNADAVPQPPERCLSRQAGIVRCCPRLERISMIPTPEQAYALVCDYNEGEFHRKHARIVGDVMRWYANELGYGAEADFWQTVGILHDLDFEQWPEQHCTKEQELMREKGIDERIIHATASHGWNLTVDIKPEHEMEKVLYAADELTGLIGACAIMLPSKSVQDLEVKSLKKKFKNKKFAAGCSRDVITSGAELLDWDLDTLFERTLAAMKASGNVD